MQSLKTGLISGVTSAFVCLALLFCLIEPATPQPIKATLSIEAPKGIDRESSDSHKLPPPPSNLRWSCCPGCGNQTKCPQCEAAEFRPSLAQAIEYAN